jgi:hypothetical protein
VIPIAITRNMSLRVDGVMVCSTYGAPAQKDGACAGTTRSADLVRGSEHCKSNTTLANCKNNLRQWPLKIVRSLRSILGSVADRALHAPRQPQTRKSPSCGVSKLEPLPARRTNQGRADPKHPMAASRYNKS